MNWQIEEHVDLRHPNGTLTWPDMLMMNGDNLAHKWVVHVRDGNGYVDMTEYTIVGYFERSDGNTVVVNGSVEGNTANVILPQAVYSIKGHILGIIRAIKGSQVVTLSSARWVVKKAYGDSIIDPGQAIPSIDELLARINEMERATVNANNAAANARQEFTAIGGKIGDLSKLTTSNKSNLVSAINEAAHSASFQISEPQDGHIVVTFT